MFNFLTVTVIGHIPFHLANTKNRTGIVTHFISKPTNQGSVEVCGKAVNRGGGLGPRKYVDLPEQLHVQDVATTQQYERRMILVQLAASKQRQRGRRLRAMTVTKSQRSETCVTEGRKLHYVNLKIVKRTLLL